MMPFQLSADQVTRLALARYLLRHAEDLLDNPQPLSSLALLSAHDAIEMVLDVLAEAANASIAASSNFASYWNLNNYPNPVHLPLERQMKRLNQARVGLKHHGQRPSGDQLTTHLDNARSFIEDVCDKNFAASLSEISLIDLIRNEEARDCLRDARQAIDRHDLREAFTKVSIGLAHSLGDILSLWGPRVRAQLENFHFIENDINLADNLSVFAQEIDNMFDKVSARMDKIILLVSLGTDLASYNKFTMLVPTVSFTAQGKVNHVWRRTPSDKPEDARWCIDFATDLILRIEGRGSAV